eukprot:249418-Hanusia_phi.AAC.1
MADESVGHTNSRAAISRYSTCTRARASFLANPEAAGTVNSVTIGEVLSDWKLYTAAGETAISSMIGP